MKHIAAVVAGLLLAFVGTSATYAATHTVCPSGCDYTTIQAAIDASDDGDVISIHAGTFHEHSLDTQGGAITIQGTLNSDGTLATTIDAQHGGTVFVFKSKETSGTVIKDLIITGGQSTDGGGGIDCAEYCSPTITNCTITGNSTITAKTPGSGGGIACEDCSPTITDCIISGNTSGRGGGIYCWSSSAIITGCTIEGNTVTADEGTSGEGGGIYCDGYDNPTITNCTITGNTAHGQGGGIYCAPNISPTLNYTVICGNTGGQVACESGTACYTNNGSGISDDCGTSTVIVTLALQIRNLGEVVNSQQSAIHDLQQVVEACCSSACAGDHDSNGHIDVEDLLHIMATWGPCAQ